MLGVLSKQESLQIEKHSMDEDIKKRIVDYYSEEKIYLLKANSEEEKQEITDRFTQAKDAIKTHPHSSSKCNDVVPKKGALRCFWYPAPDQEKGSIVEIPATLPERTIHHRCASENPHFSVCHRS